MVRRRRFFAWFAAALALVAVAVLLHRLSDVVRGAPVRALAGDGAGRSPPRISDPRFDATIAALAETALEPGNRVEILPDTAVFSRMLADIRAAHTSVTAMLYYCRRGRLGDTFARALEERARAGVAVLLLGDGYDCGGYTRSVAPALRAAGARVAVLRPLHWYALHRAQHRNHTRLVVIDGATAYTGGFGIADKWLAVGEGGGGWRDTNVRFTGPAVRAAQAEILAAWAEATGRLPAGAAFMPGPSSSTTPSASSPAMSSPRATSAPVVAGLLFSHPGLGTTPAERFLALTIAGAQRTLYITNSYFVPTPLLRRLLADAARRGVDVRILVPGPRTDVPGTRYAGRGFNDELLSAGIGIYEYQPTMIHAKTLVADGVWSAIGSLNLDNRSIRLNDESALLVHDAGVGATMDSLFFADLGRSHEITLAAWRARPLWERFLEATMRSLAPVL